MRHRNKGPKLNRSSAHRKAMAANRKLNIGRVGEAQEFANIACFLCSNAGSYINGVAINVDGGMSPVP